jgi:hypothetical protein
MGRKNGTSFPDEEMTALSFGQPQCSIRRVFDARATHRLPGLGGESNHDKNGPHENLDVAFADQPLLVTHAAHRPLSTSSFFPRGVVGLVRSHHGERDKLVATGMGGWEEEGRITRCLPGGLGRRWSCPTTCHQPPPPRAPPPPPPHVIGVGFENSI